MTRREFNLLRRVGHGRLFVRGFPVYSINDSFPGTVRKIIQSIRVAHHVVAVARL